MSWGFTREVEHRMGRLEQHVDICDARNESRIEKDNEMMVILTKLNESLSNQARREEVAEKEHLRMMKENNKTLEDVLKKLTEIEKTAIERADENKMHTFQSAADVLKEVSDNYATIPQLETASKALLMRMTYMWTALGMVLTTVIITVTVFGWLYVNVVKPKQQPVEHLSHEVREQ